MEKAELREQVKKAFSAMHDDELYDTWGKFAQVMGYADSVTVRLMHDLDGFFKDWGTRRLFMLFKDSQDFRISDEYYSFYKWHLISAGNLTVDFLPIADNLDDAIDFVVEHKNDLGNARLKEVLGGTADERTFMSVKEDFLRVMGTLATEEQIRVYNECIRRNPGRMIYPMMECIIQEITENDNDFGIPEIRNFISVHDAYDDFGSVTMD